MPTPSPRPVAARILWPALGFPAVIAPRAAAPGKTAESDATRTICVLVLTDTPLTVQDASRYLRCVPWGKRKTLSIKAGDPGSFPATELTVRRPTEINVQDAHGKALSFGGGITVSLSKYVRRFYDRLGLRHLYEIRVSEAATARLTEDQYHVFWNKEAQDQSSHSSEMNLLLDRFVPDRLKSLPSSDDRSFLTNGYKFEYGGLGPRVQAVRDPALEPTEVLHPVFLRRNLKPTLSIGHVTDTHVDVRNDVYARNLVRESAKVLKATGGRRVVFNNWNDAFELVYSDSKSKSDVILLTGDLIDYGRGHLGKRESDHQLGRDDRYYFDRNWFLLYYLMATKGNYSTPVYTTLGNHDWRLNPYPPFAPSTPNHEEFIHNSIDFKPEEHETVLKKVMELAHGDGHDKPFAYAELARDVVEILKTAWKAKSLLPSFLFGTKANLDRHKLPTHTTEESVAWYLLLINPFLNYQFALHTGHEFLLLDFAEQEELNREEDGHGFGPRALSCLTPLQQWHVEQFLKTPGKAKTLGIHVPPIGPRPGWSVNDLKVGMKTYQHPNTPKYTNRNFQVRWLRNVPLPLLAVAPATWSPWLAAAYGSFVNKDTRQWLIKKLIGSSVRVVVSGHIHRQGLFTVYARPLQLPPPGPREPGSVIQVLAVRSVEPQAVRHAKVPFATSDQSRLPGPVYVNTTSAGPKGYQYYDDRKYSNVPPGFTVIHLKNDGEIDSISGGPAYPVSTTMPKTGTR
jgi:hypothetical protein